MTLKEYIKKGPSIVCCDTPMTRIAPIYVRTNNQMYVEISLTKFNSTHYQTILEQEIETIKCCRTQHKTLRIYLKEHEDNETLSLAETIDLNLIPQDADQIKTSYEDNTTKRNIEEAWTYSNFEELKQKHGSKKVISYNIESTYSDGIEIILKRN